jgi:ATP-dependent Clp protease protease subunit
MQTYEIGPPPDLPSLLLANRIIYIGMPLVPSVTELVIAQLLYLNYQNEEIITMYINSPGTNSPDGRAFSFDTEAFAIADTMQFIRPPIRTIAVGQAFGTAAMLLSLGQKGNRFALPNASIMLNQPRSRARGQASDVAIKARETLNNRKVTNEFLAKVGVYICVYMYTYILYMRICLYMCIYICTHIYIYVCIYISIYVFIYICISEILIANWI